jgi:tetraacyldisaccharide 4'-kinase
MRAPSFWDSESHVASRLLAPIAAAYGALAAQRMRQAGRSVGVPVVCIGNLTHGGAGKTPTAIAAATLLMQAGERPWFLSRGYGGRLAGPLRVDPTRHRAVDVGDEPLLLTRVAPTIVARDRVAGAQAAQAGGASVVVMDDGFQNPSLAKTRAVLVIDGRRGIGNGRVFPAGPLRAPLSAQLERAHGLVVIGDIAGAKTVLTQCRERRLPIFHGRLVPDSRRIGTQPVLAFAGIADPEKFFATLRAAGVRAPVTRSFPDHHRYTPRDATSLISAAEEQGLELLTTEKDLVRLTGDPALGSLAARTRALPVSLVLEDAEAFCRFLLAGAPPTP